MVASSSTVYLYLIVISSQCSYVPTRARASYLRAPLWTEQGAGRDTVASVPSRAYGPRNFAPPCGRMACCIYFKNPASPKFRAVNSSAFSNFQFLLASCNNQWAWQAIHTQVPHALRPINQCAQTVTDSNMWHSNMTVRFIVHLWDQLIHIHARQT